MRLVLLACGSRGDVQPIFALALRLAEEANAVRIVTHLAHQVSSQVLTVCVAISRHAQPDGMIIHFFSCDACRHG